MEKRFIVLILLTIGLFCHLYATTADNEKTVVTINNYKKLTAQQLLDKGDDFASNNFRDSALICYSMIYNSNVSALDTLSKQMICKAMNRASRLYFYYSNYPLAFELLLQSLDLCETIGYKEYIGNIYNNIGNVYSYFRDYKSARKYYELAYNNITDKYLLPIVTNNLGILAKDDKNDFKTALSLYKEAAKIKAESEENEYNFVFNSIGHVYKEMGKYDSALINYRKGLNSAKRFLNKESQALILSNIGELYFDVDNYDSATYYFKQSNLTAEKTNVLKVMASNYFYLSKILEKENKTKAAFDMYKLYSKMNDSIYNEDKYIAISELQSMYNMGKVNKQIQELNTEQEIKERTIIIQQRLQIVTGLILLIVAGFSVILYRKHKNMNKAYNRLVDKNIEIDNSDKFNEQLCNEYQTYIKELEDKIKLLTEDNQTQKTLINKDDVRNTTHNIAVSKYKNSSLKDDYKDELIASILKIMENKEIFCNPDFSVDMLSEIVGSNPNYVSQVINDTFKQNFRPFINAYRVKEARRILSDPECRKFTIESIGEMVGFKSRRSFDSIFKEITGVSPSFYLKSSRK